MYTAYNRLSSLCSFYTSALIATLLLIAGSNYFMPCPAPNVKLGVGRVQLYHLASFRRGIEDYYVNKSSWLADLTFDIEADFSGLFHWNTKQLFLYVVYEYATAKSPRNSLVLWDRIMRARDFHRIDLHGVKAKYAACDLDDKLPGTEGSIKLYWNTVPHVGLLTTSQAGETAVVIPS